MADSEMTREDVEIVSRTIGYDGFSKLHVIHLRHRRHNGGWSDVLEREVYERANAAAMLLYDPERDLVALLEQCRPGAYLSERGCWQLEPVAGIVQTGESPEDVAVRETKEEAGCEVSSVQPLGAYLVSPGCATETVHCFVGRIDSREVGGIHGHVEEGEDIRVHVLPMAEVREGLANGRFEYALTLICLQWLVINRDALRRAWLDEA
ncbi:MAG: NUDIX domain-containing protein [Alphaproteobacteria bacterium]